ncbi:copper amine oxidase N-terminal domain-containing protein [Paenibacillus sp. PR3]|uniref:Copper amine oxidase N-terminal domain-containing protein n=1 Tax=Paenibacillus terricola TaxID=2763503 RepID=A0ABR8MWB0_9BACL|nr:copper amine oxidase N-terminal domain-containing protein [Paenibacillus terricola]MBD3920259.1 copper amine oxidase N-terminal domain-containing protein [Paenibacillus terricola]
MKRSFIGTVILLLALLLGFEGSTQAAVKSSNGNNATTALKLVIDDRISSETAYVMNGTSYVPVAPIAAAIGGKVVNANGKTNVQWGGTIVTLTSGSKKATINGEPVPLPQVAATIKGRLYIPLKAVSGMFGINAVYHAADKRMILTTSHNEAIIYGYSVDKNGRPVQQGFITFRSLGASPISYTASVTNGYYRVDVPEGTYSATVLHKNNVPARTTDLSGYTVTVKNKDRVFLGVSQPQPDLTINVHYEDGKPVESGTLVMMTSGGEERATIDKGQADFSVEEKGQIFFNRIEIDHANNEQWDVYAFYDADPERLNAVVDVIVHRANVRLQVNQNGVLKNVDGSIMIGDSQLMGRFYDYKLVNGEAAVYLPQGSYQWTEYWTGNDSFLYVNPRKQFEVTDDKVPMTVVTDIIGSKVQGVLQSSEGSPMKGGTLYFSLSSDPSQGTVGLAMVDFSNGKYAVILPDGTYSVAYAGGSSSDKYIVTDSFVVTNGKAVISNLVVPS